MITSVQLCKVWMQTATARNNRTIEQHEETKRNLVKLLRESGAHSLTISQRMDIAHYCVFATTARLCEQVFSQHFLYFCIRHHCDLFCMIFANTNHFILKFLIFILNTSNILNT